MTHPAGFDELERTGACHGFLPLALSYELSPEPELVGGCAAGAAGLYTAAGRAGPLFCLISFFFGFFFSRPRASRLPMTCSPSC
jgi:hypothetical protein